AGHAMPLHRSPTMPAESNVESDVAIVGSGFAGALIAKALGKSRRVVILEAGEGIPPNINDYMKRFYSASAKVAESPYTPAIFDADGNLRDPSTVKAGRPISGVGNWKDPKQSYLIQKGPRPFGSTYDRIAGGTSHWLGTCLRLVPNDFKMQSRYGQLVDWPIEYKDLIPWYREAEKELGVSANVEDQQYLGIEFPDNYKYPMPKIPESFIDREVAAALKAVTPDETDFLKMG